MQYMQKVAQLHRPDKPQAKAYNSPTQPKARKPDVAVTSSLTFISHRRITVESKSSCLRATLNIQQAFFILAKQCSPNFAEPPRPAKTQKMGIRLDPGHPGMNPTRGQPLRHIKVSEMTSTFLPFFDAVHRAGGSWSMSFCVCDNFKIVPRQHSLT